MNDQALARELQQRDLATVRRKLSGLIDAIADGLRAPGLQAQLNELEARKAKLEAEQTAPAPIPPALHPNLANVYRERVAHLHAALHCAGEGREVLETLRALIDRVVVTPSSESAAGMEIELIGELAAMIRLTGRNGAAGTGRTMDHDLFERSVKVVAGACNHLDLLLTG